MKSAWKLNCPEYYYWSLFAFDSLSLRYIVWALIIRYNVLAVLDFWQKRVVSNYKNNIISYFMDNPKFKAPISHADMVEYSVWYVLHVVHIC